MLSRFATNNTLRLMLRAEIANSAGIAAHQVEEMLAALQEMGLADTVATEQWDDPRGAGL